jgi:hypothetical protein
MKFRCFVAHGARFVEDFPMRPVILEGRAYGRPGHPASSLSNAHIASSTKVLRVISDRLASSQFEITATVRPQIDQITKRATRLHGYEGDHPRRERRTVGLLPETAASAAVTVRGGIFILSTPVEFRYCVSLLGIACFFSSSQRQSRRTALGRG